MTLLVVEDEQKMLAILKRALLGQYYAVDTAKDGEEGLRKALTGDYAVILLDLMLPKKDGMEVCKELRRRNIHTPIIMLTARGITEDRVKGLDIGADDYLTKPFELNELFARIRAVLRRPKTTQALTLKVADLVMDTRAHEVTRGGKKLMLTPKEYKILDILMRRPGAALRRQELLHAAWGPEFKEDSHELNVHMRYLREKVDEGFPKKLIQTVRGVGYTIKE